MTARNADAVRGRTIRLSWTTGPTKGTTHEHVFHQDGTVEWRSVSDDETRGSTSEDTATGASEDTAAGASKQSERAPYVAVQVGAEVWMVSYLSSSGYTLTVVLNFGDRSTTGVASNEKNWVPVSGRFEVVS